MQAVRALFDGQDIRPLEPIKTKERTEVLIIFPTKEEDITPSEVRNLLKGSGKGEKLTERLLKSRTDDMKNEPG